MHFFFLVSDQNPKDGDASNMKMTEQQLKMTEKVKKLEVRCDTCIQNTYLVFFVLNAQEKIQEFI